MLCFGAVQTGVAFPKTAPKPEPVFVPFVVVCRFAGFTTFLHMWHIAKSLIVPYIVSKLQPRAPKVKGKAHHLCTRASAQPRQRPKSKMPSTGATTPAQNRRCRSRLTHASINESPNIEGSLRRFTTLAAISQNWSEQILGRAWPAASAPS